MKYTLTNKQTNKQTRDYLSKNTTDCLKGLFAIIVVACHLRNNLLWMNNTILGQFFTVSGYLSVAMFFFFSGYGMTFQYENKGKQYIEQFPKRRLLDFYVKYIIVILIYFIFGLVRGNFPKPISILKTFTFGGTLVANGWYIQAILFSYIFFYLIVRFLPKRFFALALTASFIIYLTLCLSLGLGGLWWQSYLAYFLGIIWAKNKVKIDNFLSKKYNFILTLLLSFVLFGITLLLGNLNIVDPFSKTIIKSISSVFFVIFVLCLNLIINFSNKISSWLGKFSFEIYVIHGIFLNLFNVEKGIMSNDVVYIIAVFAASILSATLLNRIFVFISKKIKG